LLRRTWPGIGAKQTFRGWVPMSVFEGNADKVRRP
jgi:hypothetical protein